MVPALKWILKIFPVLFFVSRKSEINICLYNTQHLFILYLSTFPFWHYYYYILSSCEGRGLATNDSLIKKIHIYLDCGTSLFKAHCWFLMTLSKKTNSLRGPKGLSGAGSASLGPPPQLLALCSDRPLSTFASSFPIQVLTQVVPSVWDALLQWWIPPIWMSMLSATMHLTRSLPFSIFYISTSPISIFYISAITLSLWEYLT